MSDPLGEGVTIHDVYGEPPPAMQEPATRDQGGDHIIPALRADQTMSALAVSVCLTISSFCEDGDLKKGQILFALFVHQLASFSKEPEMMAKLLRIVADEMDTKAEASAEEQAAARVREAAPEPLAALKKVVAIADRKTDEFDRARAAIAKAEGSA